MANRLDACLNHTITPERLEELSRPRSTWNKKYYRENREKCQTLTREWSEAHPEKVRDYARKSSHKRRTVINELGSGDLDVFFETERVCPITGSADVQCEHIFPISLGWMGNSQGNLMWLHRNLNSSKGDKNLFTWISELSQEDLDFLLRDTTPMKLDDFKTIYREFVREQASLLGMSYLEYKKEYFKQYRESKNK